MHMNVWEALVWVIGRVEQIGNTKKEKQSDTFQM